MNKAKSFLVLAGVSIALLLSCSSDVEPLPSLPNELSFSSIEAESSSSRQKGKGDLCTRKFEDYGNISMKIRLVHLRQKK